jgi:thiamine kinase-like enzyme
MYSLNTFLQGIDQDLTYYLEKKQQEKLSDLKQMNKKRIARELQGLLFRIHYGSSNSFENNTLNLHSYLNDLISQHKPYKSILGDRLSSLLERVSDYLNFLIELQYIIYGMSRKPYSDFLSWLERTLFSQADLPQIIQNITTVLLSKQFDCAIKENFLKKALKILTLKPLFNPLREKPPGPYLKQQGKYQNKPQAVLAAKNDVYSIDEGLPFFSKNYSNPPSFSPLFLAQAQGPTDLSVKAQNIDPNTERLINYMNVEDGKKINCGGNGTVYHGHFDGKPAAFKKTNSSKKSKQGAMMLEAKIMFKLRSPHFVEFYGLCMKDQDYYLIMELMEDSLHNFLKKQPGLIPTQRYDIASQVATGIAYLHQLGYIHRDLKTHNFLIDSTGKIKMADFDTATPCCANQIVQKTSHAGTQPWMAPDIFTQSDQNIYCYSQATDMYALGVILLEIVTLLYPFQGIDKSMIILYLKEGNGYLTDPVMNQIPVEFRNGTYHELIRNVGGPASNRYTATVIQEKLSQLLDLPRATPVLSGAAADSRTPESEFARF